MEREFVPALGRQWLTELYDPLVERWEAARRIRRAVVAALAVRPGHRVLELGAGPGRLAVDIKRGCPGAAVTALDIDPAMTARARRNAQRASVDVDHVTADMTKAFALGSFDCVCSTMTFHHLRPAQKVAAIREAKAALRGAGRLVVVDFGRPRDLLQHALFRFVQQPLDGFENTVPHRTGDFERLLRRECHEVRSERVWKTAAGTIEMFVCFP